MDVGWGGMATEVKGFGRKGLSWENKREGCQE